MQATAVTQNHAVQSTYRHSTNGKMLATTRKNALQKQLSNSRVDQKDRSMNRSECGNVKMYFEKSQCIEESV